MPNGDIDKELDEWLKGWGKEPPGDDLLKKLATQVVDDDQELSQFGAFVEAPVEAPEYPFLVPIEPVEEPKGKEWKFGTMPQGISKLLQDIPWLVKSLELGFKGLETVLQPAEWVGSTLRALHKVTPEQWAERQTEYKEVMEQRDRELAQVVSEEESQQIYESYLPRLRELSGISPEMEAEFRELPWYQQLLYESPFWIGTAALPTATAIRGGLAPIAAKGGLKAVPAIAARTALAPVAGVEAVTGFVLQQTIGRIATIPPAIARRLARAKFTKSQQAMFESISTEAQEVVLTELGNVLKANPTLAERATPELISNIASGMSRVLEAGPRMGVVAQARYGITGIVPADIVGSSFARQASKAYAEFVLTWGTPQKSSILVNALKQAGQTSEQIQRLSSGKAWVVLVDALSIEGTIDLLFKAHLPSKAPVKPTEVKPPPVKPVAPVAERPIVTKPEIAVPEVTIAEIPKGFDVSFKGERVGVVNTYIPKGEDALLVQKLTVDVPDIVSKGFLQSLFTKLGNEAKAKGLKYVDIIPRDLKVVLYRKLFTEKVYATGATVARIEVSKIVLEPKPLAVEPTIVEKPAVKPPPPVSPVARKQEITTLLTTPAKELPKGTSKIALRQELSEINAKLVPAEKKLRQQIMAQVKTLGLPESQYRKIFKNIGGSRRLSEIDLTNLEKILPKVRVTRPVSIKGKKVITTKTEELIQASKQDLIDEGVLTEETYRDILKGLKLSTDKYTGRESFISQSEGAGIIREMRNRAILFPLGELKFAQPTTIKYLTSQTYYAQRLGVKPLVEPLELAKVDLDLAHRAMANAIDQQKGKGKRAWKDITKLRDALEKFEEAPAGLTSQQVATFNWLRNLNRTIINGENEVRRGLGMPEIPYREAYVRHVPEAMAEEIFRGTHPIPPSLEYWSKRIVSKKVFNPMELRRMQSELTDDLTKLYTRDPYYAAKNMAYIGLKEIHLAQPLKAFTERMGALSDIIPASTRRWVIDYVNQVIKGQQTEWDANLNRLVTESGIGGLINDVLRPYNRSLGTQPVTKVAQTIGHGTILAVLALPRPRLARLMIRNTFQRTQELALHNPLSVLKGFIPETGTLEKLMAESRFLKGYTGVEEWPVDLMGKVGKLALAPYQTTAVINARQAMRTTYHDVLAFFTKSKYKDLGWASPKRTYTEPEGFLYPEEETLMLKEMDWAARATQYQYIGMGMPEIFRNKTLIPLTRLQSWWMNHIFMFHREAASRFLYGETGWGGKLPWTKRVNYLTYLLLGGAILTSMGYGMSYLWRVLPHNLSPVGQFMAGLLTLASADSDWQREKGKREMFSSWKAMVPGPLAYDEFEKLWSGEMPLWQMFFYGREEEEMPPRPPTWGIINREPALNMKVAKRDITEAEGQLGQVVPTELPEPYYYIDETGERKLYTPTEEEYVYTTVDLGAAIKRATLKLEDKDITKENGFTPLSLFYKEAEGMWGHYYYSLPSSQRIEFRESPDGAYIEAYLFFWGKLSVLRNPNSEDIVRGWLAKYNIPEVAIPKLGVRSQRKEEAQLKEADKARLDFLRRQ